MASSFQKNSLAPTSEITNMDSTDTRRPMLQPPRPPLSQHTQTSHTIQIQPSNAGALDRAKSFEVTQTPVPDKDIVFYTPIYKAAFEGEWKAFRSFIKSTGTSIDVAISSSRKTALHVAAYSGQTTFVKKLVNHKHMKAEMLGKVDTTGHTALFFAVAAGNLEAVKAMMNKYPILPLIENLVGTSPILEAALLGQKEMLLYLYKNIDEELVDGHDPRVGNPFRGTAGLKLLNAIIAADFYDIAIDLVKLCPELATMQINNVPTALDVLAQRSSSFKSGSNLGFWQRCIYSVIHTVPSCRGPLRSSGYTKGEKQLLMKVEEEDSDDDLEDPGQNLMGRTQKFKKIFKDCKKGGIRPITSTINLVVRWFKTFLFAIVHPVLHMLNPLLPVLQRLRLLWDTIILTVPGIRSVHNTKLMHQDAARLIKRICKKVAKLETYTNISGLVNNPFLVAAECGSVDFMLVCLEFFPALMSIHHQSYTILHYCIINRQEKLFKLLHHKRIDACSKSLAAYQVGNGTTILHLAAKLAPPEKLKTISGAALQMQHEIQWFKAVEKITKPTYKESKIEEVLDASKIAARIKPLMYKPRELFMEEHKKLMEEGEKWMRELSQSCTVVGTLITTMVFAAAITVPGGNNDKGNPEFLKNKYYMVFAISDALSLISSITSVLIFLSALTSRYNIDDFLVSLPRKVIFGLGTLFISVATMFVAFISTYFIMFNTHYDWVAPLVAALISFPAIIFVVSQFPLFAELLSSTYGFGLLHRKSKGV